MNPSEEALFADALEIVDPKSRAEFLDRACAGNKKLRASVESLLAAYNAGSFLEVPALKLGQKSHVNPDDDTEAEPSEQYDHAGTLSFLAASDKPGSLGRLAHYEVLEIIGQGGMGIVLRAFDEKLHRVVAIKVMSPELAATSPPRKRFLREARSAAQVRHEHVVDIHAVEDLPIPYLVMEYVSGETLQQKLDRVGPLETPDVLRFGQQIARGLAAAHEKGLIHRDIKPSNILLEKGAEERVKITDFGLARAVADASLTQSGVIAGTPMYMAPEQTLGDSIDHRADLFSLGSVLYTMASGRPPFRATTSMATLKRVAEDEPRPIRDIIPEVPQWLCDIIAKLHAKNPDERFQSAKEVADLLKQHLLHLENPALVPMPAPVVVPAQKAAKAEEPAPQPILPAGTAVTPMPVQKTGVTDEATLQPIPPAPLGGEGLSVSQRRRWPVAAAILLALIGGLSLTEATGVTQLRGTVIRIFTPDGTLVVETNDPSVKVTIEGDGGLVITGAGLEEIRLRPGSYKVHADRDGKKLVLDRELVSISKGGREIVRVKLEAPPPAVSKGEKNAFVVLSSKGTDAGKFATLTEAVTKAASGDTIEIRGNGPFFTDPIDLGAKPLTIRAGAGYAPVIKSTPAAVRAEAAGLLKTDSRLTLEGLEIHREGRPETSKAMDTGVIFSTSGPLYLTNCKLIVGHSKVAAGTTFAIATHSSSGQLRNCVIVSPQCGLFLWNVSGVSWTVDNCLIAASESAFFMYPEESYTARTKVRLTRSQLIGGQVAALPGPGGPLVKRLRDKSAPPLVPAVIEAEENIIQSSRIFAHNSSNSDFPDGLSVDEQRRYIPKMIRWQERGNVYAVDDKFLLGLGTGEIDLLKDLVEWNQFWGLKDTGSVLGKVRLRGNPKDMVEKTPEAITPDDFRPRPDSAGYQAGKDKKDLGADVDLIGPGAAYERWKKTPEYQQWLKETGQVSAGLPRLVPNAFVVLGGKGVEVGKFDTLAEAVKWASSGDTIEIRGNGPFLTDQIDFGPKALTIRSGSGYAPVIKPSPAAVKADGALLWTEGGALTLEGLELHHEGFPEKSERGIIERGIVAVHGPTKLHMTNCKLVVNTGKPGHCWAVIGMRSLSGHIRNCLMVSPGYAMSLWPGPGTRWDVNNCLIANGIDNLGAPILLVPDDDNSPGAKLRLSRNTLVSGVTVAVDGPDEAVVERLRDKAAKPVVPIAIESEGNVCQHRYVLTVRPPRELQRQFIPSFIQWRERGNLYMLEDPGKSFLGMYAKEFASSFKDLVEWNQFWGLKDTGSAPGTVLLRGKPKERIATAPETITVDDFRLRPDSAGYQVGKDKKDLGADVDLVGPGAAYERWKKTPEYQQWLKDSGQTK